MEFVQIFLALFVLQLCSAQQFDVHGRVDAGSIRSFHMELTSQPHPAGSDRDRELAQYVKQNFQASRMDRVQSDYYNALLSYPDPDRPNKVTLKDGTGEVAFLSKHKETSLQPEDDFTNILDSFLAFTPAGSVTGPPVYANYAQESDFDVLDASGVAVNGSIVLARFGFGHRGNKVKAAEERGAVGVVLFSDPEEGAMQGTDALDVYPNAVFLPGDGMQRGTTKVLISGDILSSGWTSVDNAYRETFEERKGVPNIPAQPIGYEDAQQILAKMGGPTPPTEFVGGIEGVEYNLGGQFSEEFADWTLELETNNFFQEVSDNENVIGIIRGSEEPDRYVILCNHRDAWTFGGVDPSSATALLLEAARVMGDGILEGWRPKRSIVLASWAVEEYGTIGSSEWVLHKLPKLLERAVAVVNVDGAVEGPILKPSASPSLSHLPVEASKDFPDPANPSNPYYDFWKDWVNGGSGGDLVPTSSLIGGGSDHDPFTFTAGVPSIKLAFRNDEKAVPGLYTNPAYHTAYDTFYLVDDLIDPGYLYHKLATELAVSIVTELADAEILSFNFQPMATVMSDAIADFQANGVASLLEANGATLQYLSEAVQQFSDSVAAFNETLSEVDTSNALELRMINDQIMAVERTFLPLGYLPGREDARHLIYSPSRFDRYGASAFPGLTDLLYEVQQLAEQAEVDAKWKEIKRHLSDLMIAVKQAADFLQAFEMI